MRTVSCSFFLLIALLFSAGPTAAERSEAQDWTRLETDSLPAEWRELHQRLTAPAWVIADFVERREFSFRRQPVELTGTVWFGREEGLTLAYRSPRREIVRVDARGVRVIREDGSSSRRRPPGRGGDIPSALLALFRFDFAELERKFEILGRQEGRQWFLRLEPLEENNGALQRVDLTGTGEELTRIAIEQTNSQRIELTLSNTAFPAELDREERARIFP